MSLYYLYTNDLRKVGFTVVSFGSSVPKDGGLYAVFSFNRLLYIGRADDLDARCGSGVWNHEKALLLRSYGAQFVGFAPISNVLLRNELEAALIEQNAPPLNDLHNPLARYVRNDTKNALRGDFFS